mmetsp:Transcript_5/g.16  ORF Transcript_5/g.16 Transcript_5/m.16 type:complete len:106 (+) Transcript_5:989-1306(+)
MRRAYSIPTRCTDGGKNAHADFPGSKDNAQAGRFFSDLHADPAINRLIEKAGWTEGDHSRQTPRHIASLHEKCLDYVRARTSFNEDAWRRLDYVDGVLSKYTNRV